MQAITYHYHQLLTQIQMKMQIWKVRMSLPSLLRGMMLRWMANSSSSSTEAMSGFVWNGLLSDLCVMKCGPPFLPVYMTAAHTGHTHYRSILSVSSLQVILF